MKYKFNNKIFRSWLLMLAMALPAALYADDNTGDVDAAESAAMAKTKENAPVLQETDPTGANYMSQRRALVGKHCSVNRVINVVSVGSGTSGLENLTNEDLSDEAVFPSTAGVTIAASPTVSVRDMKYYYAAGTTAGFCLVASSGSSVLNLDVIKTMHLWFYCDGVRVADQTVREGNAGSGVKLSLIGIPGNQEACVNLTAVCPAKFDEVALVQGGGLDVSVASALRIKYAFVGDAHDIYMTKIGIANYCTENGLPSYNVSCDAFMPSPLVGGIPIPMANASEADVIGTDTDERLDETIALVSAVQLVSVAFKGRVRVNVENSDTSVGELFHKGDQVGFKYNFANVADVLALGTWVDIKLYDHSGNAVQTTTIGADVLSLAIASGGDQTSYIIAEDDFSGAEISFYTTLGVLNLGSGFGVYYAFVRPEPTFDHECEINPTCDTNLCNSQTSIQLKSNPEVNVTWTLESQPEENNGQCTVTAGGYVTGMVADGEYQFRATSEDGCYEIVTINHADSEEFQEESAEHIFYAKDGYELATDLHEQTSANLLSISDLSGSDNVLDDDLTNYATYTAGLQLAGSNGILIGIKKSDNTYFYDGSKADALDEIQIGFVVEMEQTSIGLDLLNTFQIRCFDESGNRVYQSLVEDAGVLGLSLIGNNTKSNLMRMTITVPKVNGDGNSVKINEIQLWKVGVLDLDVDDVKYYYGFWADPSDKRNNVVRDGATVVTYDNMGAIVNLGTQVDVAAVGCVTNNLSNIIDIDDELETYALVQKTVDAGSQEIIVKMGRTLDYRHQVGVVINKDIVALNVQLANVVRIGTYYNGQDTGETSTNWNVLGANLIQGDDKVVLYLQPTSPYDEIHITLGGGLSANETMKIYGILLRNDIDHDGSPDVRDTESCTDGINNIVVTKVCEGEDLTITGLGTTETDFKISLPDQGVVMVAIQSDQDGKVTYTVETRKSGRYTVYFYNATDNLISTADYVVYPTKTTWRTTTNNKEWNKWENWTNGSPYLCTDVIMPANARTYPSLDEDVTLGDEFGCDRIYFENRAAVEKVYKLNYSQAWVDVELEPGRYYLMTAPLQNMYTGDMFIPTSDPVASEEDYFTELTGNNYVQNRFAPRIYQRLWAKAADVKLANGTLSTGAATIQETHWSKRFNALAYNYGRDEGFSLWVEPESNTAETFTFRFPKMQTAYNYFNEVTKQSTSMEESELTKTNAHRLAHENGQTATSYTYKSDNDRQHFASMGNLTLTATAEENTNTFLVGNPFMSHIDVAKFLEGNANVNEVKAYDGNTTNSAIAVAGTLISTDPSFTTILPMEAFFVGTNSQSTSLEVTLADDMFYMEVVEMDQVENENENAVKTRAGKSDASMLRVVATSNGIKAGALLLGGDLQQKAETLFDDEVLPKLAVFTISEGRGFDIQPAAGLADIPLGIYATGKQTIRLSFETFGNFPADQYVLVDRETGATYSLDDAVEQEVEGSNMGRFYLHNATTATGIETAQAGSQNIYVTFSGNVGTVHSTAADIVRVELFSVDGQLISNKAVSSVQTVDVESNVNMGVLRVTLASGEKTTLKYVLP